MECSEKTGIKAFQNSFLYVDEEKSAASVVDCIKQSDWAAIDIEGSSLHSFNDNIALIQLSIADGIYIIDPLSEIDTASILEEISNKEIIFHGGDYDLRMLLADYDFHPQNTVYDTMLGSELLGIESVGLAAVVLEFFGKTICKAGQRSDWTKRPLTDKQLEYASTDVAYLKQLKDLIAARLDLLGRFDWWRQCNERLVQNSENTKDNGKEAWKIKGYTSLQSYELRYLKELWSWRQDLAKSVDKPVFKIMGNDSLLKFAGWLAANPGKNPKKFNSLPKICRGKSFEKLSEHIKTARKLDKNLWPVHTIKRQNFRVEPDKELVEDIKNCVNDKAQKLGIKPQLILTRAKMEAIAVRKPKSTTEIASAAELMEWQKEIIAPDIMSILASRL
jgi:ribonuclease D